MVTRYSYTRWDGTQKLALDAEELLDQLADRLIDGEDPRWALQKLMREGFQRPDGQRMEGLRELLEKIKQARQERLNRHDLGKVVDELREALDRIIQKERDTVEQKLQQAQGRQRPQQQQEGGQQGEPGEQDGDQSDGQQSDAQQPSGSPMGASPRSGQQGQSGQPGQSGDDVPEALKKALERIAK